MYNEGISKLGEIIDMGVKFGFIEKSGSYYSYNNIRLGQGRENVKNYLKQNQSTADDIEKKIRDYISNDNSIVINSSSQLLEEEAVF